MASNLATLEERVEQLEAAVSQLRREKTGEPTQASPSSPPWWTQIWGTFKNDPDYDEAMRLGREWRDSHRPPLDEAQRDAA